MDVCDLHRALNRRDLRPLIIKKTGYPAIPRRYEETKHGIHQVVTHRDIIAEGTRTEEQTEAHNAAKRDDAVRVAEETVRLQAQLELKQKLEKQRKKLQKQHEKATKTLKEQHARDLETEAARVRKEMEKKLQAAVEDTKRAQAEEFAKETEELKKRLAEEYNLREQEARNEERQNAEEMKKQLTKEAAERLAVALEVAERQKHEAVAHQKFLDSRDLEFAVADAKSAEQLAAANQMAELRRSHDEKMGEVKKYVLVLEEMLHSTEANLGQETQLVQNLVRELLDTRDEFQNFINTTKHFCPKHSEYVLPPVRSVDIHEYLEAPMHELD